MPLLALDRERGVNSAGTPRSKHGLGFPSSGACSCVSCDLRPPSQLVPRGEAAWTPESVLDENRAGFGPHPDADGLLNSCTSASPSVTRACVS